MARRNDHSREQIQQMAIAAAISILNKEGASQLSTRKVARAIGYTVGTLYLVFRNIDELLLYVNAATLDELKQAIVNACPGEQEPRTQIKAMANAYMNFAREHYARWSLLYTHRLPEEMPIPDWFNEKIQNVFALVEAPLQKLKPDMNKQACTRATRVLWSGVHGACELSLNDKLSLGSDVSAGELIESLVDNYLAGLLTG